MIKPGMDWQTNIKIAMVACLPFFIFSFVRRKNLPQSIPRTKRIKFVRHRGQWSPLRGILQRSLYPNFLPVQTDRHVLLQSCATTAQRFFGDFFAGKIFPGNLLRKMRSACNDRQGFIEKYEF